MDKDCASLSCNFQSSAQGQTATRLTKPRNSTKLETSRRARSDCFLLSRRAQPPLITGKGTRTRVVALHKCATRMATAAIDAIGPVPPTKIAKLHNYPAPRGLMPTRCPQQLVETGPCAQKKSHSAHYNLLKTLNTGDALLHQKVRGKHTNARGGVCSGAAATNAPPPLGGTLSETPLQAPCTPSRIRTRTPERATTRSASVEGLGLVSLVSTHAKSSIKTQVLKSAQLEPWCIELSHNSSAELRSTEAVTQYKL